ncbi:hypothetical protein LZ30DRAFT_787395 [Colletotrichum cereale]|nr:hypothetical protein LZ30DRAFT_787395 [Colletotrichum cereale]
MTAPDGNGVKFTVGFLNLPNKGGPFTYYLHVDPVPEDSNCTKALAHYDPFNCRETALCNASRLETC